MRSVERDLTRWGYLTVAVSGLFIIIPVFGALSIIAAIIALVLIVARLGLAEGVKAGALGFILQISVLLISSLTFGYQISVAYAAIQLITFGLLVIAPGLIMGWGARKLLSPVKIAVLGAIPLVLVFLINLNGYISIVTEYDTYATDLNGQFNEIINQNTELKTLIETQYSHKENPIKYFLDEIRKTLFEFLKILPGTVILTILGIVVFSYKWAGQIAVKAGIMFPKFRQFHLWKADSWWLLPTLAGLMLIVLFKGTIWFYIGLNILIVTSHVYMVAGLAIVEAYLRRTMISTPLKVIFYILLFLANFVSIVFLAVLGLLDAKLNFKREIEDFE